MEKKVLISIIIHVLIIVLTIRAVGSMFLYRGEGNMQVLGVAVFQYFTTLSNVLSAVASVVLVIFRIRQYLIKSDLHVLPGWIMTLRFAGTVAVGVTLLTVLLFLGPAIGYRPLFVGHNLFLHLTGPLLAIAALLFFDFGQPLNQGQVLFTVLPTFLYGSLYLYKVVVQGEARGGWKDFYGFNAGGRWYLSVLIMLAGTYLLGTVLRLAQNAAVR